MSTTSFNVDDIILAINVDDIIDDMSHRCIDRSTTVVDIKLWKMIYFSDGIQLLNILFLFIQYFDL
jgi:hypothetical protein